MPLYTRGVASCTPGPIPRVQIILRRPHVGAVDLVKRAVPPAIEGATPHQPIGRIGVLEHTIGDRNEGPLLCQQPAAANNHAEIRSTLMIRVPRNAESKEQPSYHGTTIVVP